LAVSKCNVLAGNHENKPIRAKGGSKGGKGGRLPLPPWPKKGKRGEREEGRKKEK